MEPQGNEGWHQAIAAAVEVSHMTPRAGPDSSIVVHRPMPIRGTSFIVTLPETPVFKLPDTRYPPPSVICKSEEVESKGEEELLMLEKWSCRPKCDDTDYRGPPPPPGMALSLPAEDGDWWESDSSLELDTSLPTEWFEDEDREVAPPVAVAHNEMMAPLVFNQILPPPVEFAYPPLSVGVKGVCFMGPVIRGAGRGVLGLWRAGYR